MPASDPEIILPRLSGEIATRAKPTRQRFEAHLLRNVRAAVRDAGVTAPVKRSPNRIFVASGDAGAAAALASAQMHPAEKLDEVVRLAYERLRDAVTGLRFAVRARRAGERSHIAVDPRAIERALGTRPLEHAARVAFDNPEVSVPIDLHGSHAYSCTREWRRQGGLPLGVEGSAVALLSGGFDSAVAEIGTARLSAVMQEYCAMVPTRPATSWFAKDGRYILYCAFRLKSAHLAERMCAAGFDAANCHLGLKALVARARRLATPDLIATSEPIA